MSRYGADAGVSGSIEVSGSATFNEGSLDADFRVESDGNANMLLVDAGNNRVGIGTSAPDYTLDVAGNVGVDEYIYHNGDDDTFIRFQDDDITIKAGAVNCISFTSASQCQLICNDSGDDLDFIVRSPSQNLALYLNAGNEVFHINHGESGFKTKIHSTNGEAITVNNSGVILNEDGHATNDFRIESDNNTHMLFVDAGDDKVGVGTDVPGVTLEIEAAAGDIFKMENTTAYGVTYGQLVKESLTLTDGGSPLDTTLDLPARSMITDVLVTIQTAARADAHSLENVALTVSSNTFNIKGSSFPSLSLVSNPSQGVDPGTQYVLGNTDQSFPAGRSTMLNSSTADIKLVYSDTNVSTEPIVDVVVFYKKFDTT